MNMFLKTGGLMPNNPCASTLVMLGDFFYFSGQIGSGETFMDQCISVCYKIRDVLADFDLRFDHLTSMTVYLSDIHHKDEFLQVIDQFLEMPYPAMTIVEVANLEKDSMICIQGNGVNTLRYEQKMSNAYCDDCD